MKKLLVFISFFLFACGSEPIPVLAQDPLVHASDQAGDQANFARKHLSDRGANSNNAQDRTNQAGDDTSYDASNAAESASDDLADDSDDSKNGASDSGFSSEHVLNKWQQGQDHVGKKANETRDYGFHRGPCNIVNGKNCQ